MSGEPAEAETTVSRATDSPTVKLIKGREQDLNSFRVFSYSTAPFGDNYNLLNYPNVAIVRGLESLNGYDALRLSRMSKVAGEMTIEGVVQPIEASSAQSHRGLQLFNVKYLLYEQPRTVTTRKHRMHGGIPFDGRLLNLSLTPQSSHIEFHPGETFGYDIRACELDVQLCATLWMVCQSQPSPSTLSDGGVIKGELQAGRDSSEWAFDRTDVAATIKHKRARIVESFNAGSSRSSILSVV